MVKLIPLMRYGDNVDKGHIYNILSHSPSFEGVCSYIDTSDTAKAMFIKFKARPSQAANEHFHLSYINNSDAYKSALVRIIRAFDDLKIRLYETIDRINSIQTNRSYDNQPDLFIFINVLDGTDIEFIADLADIYKPFGIETFPLLITEHAVGDDAIGKSIISGLKYYNLEFQRFENPKDSDTAKARSEITKFASDFKKTLLSR